MSGVHTPQRHALESLLKDRLPYVLKVRRGEFYLNGERIYLCGVSEGVGSCADLPGVCIAVLSQNPQDAKAIPGRVAYCSYAALLRAPSEEEGKQQRYHDCSYMVVEGLSLVAREGNIVHFEKDGAKAIYVNTF